MKKLFQYGLRMSAWLSQRPALDRLTKAFMNTLGWLTTSSKKAQAKTELDDLAKEWQRMFPAGKKYNPITKVEGNTAYAEIHGRCPLRGTNNPTACYKMMQYDRNMVDSMGGQFVVLTSQSNSGEHFCSVAMRMKGEDMSDLKEAHVV